MASGTGNYATTMLAANKECALRHVFGITAMHLAPDSTSSGCHYLAQP
jgi:hypothetical protein